MCQIARQYSDNVDSILKQSQPIAHRHRQHYRPDSRQLSQYRLVDYMSPHYAHLLRWAANPKLYPRSEN